MRFFSWEGMNIWILGGHNEIIQGFFPYTNEEGNQTFKTDILIDL